ncbi:MAG: flagellar basal body rod protein FlgB [Panacagrimonas sp.]
MATDPLFGIHAQALGLQRARMETLASNIANADTPGYQARDIDFAGVLAGIRDSAASGATGVPPMPQNPGKVYRVPMQPSVDGNTVDLQVEQAQFADSALHYQASLSFIDSRLKSLMTAITGQ